MRREYKWVGIRYPPLVGSPPRARGALRFLEERGGEVGIIPACAGSTTAASSAAWLLGDHPGVRREYMPADVWRELDTGSPPHARGALPAQVRFDPLLGITPACGEHVRNEVGRGNDIGSPPHQWGAHPGHDHPNL